MRVGTITFWWCHENYGQILQCFALQQFLRTRGHDPFLIRYKAAGYFSRTPGAILGQVLKHPWSVVASAWHLLNGEHATRCRRRERIAAKRRFETFRNSFIRMTEKDYNSYAELVRSDELSADVYTVGSDVVWKNFPFDDDGRPMFLDFGDSSAKRLAYSPSFGTKAVSDRFARFVRPLMSRFDAIGVREASGVEICGQLGRADAVHVLDPVLLLKRGDFEASFGSSWDGGRKDVFGYYLESKIPFPLQEIALSPLKDSQVRITTVYSDMGLPEDLLDDPTIPEWVEKIACARLFITNSFHGTSVAIIMHTPFLVILKDGGRGMDSRLCSLLDALGLEGRIYSPGDDFNALIVQEVNWDVVDAKLDELRKVSVDLFRRVGL